MEFFVTIVKGGKVPDTRSVVLHAEGALDPLR